MIDRILSTWLTSVALTGEPGHAIIHRSNGASKATGTPETLCLMFKARRHTPRCAALMTLLRPIELTYQQGAGPVRLLT